MLDVLIRIAADGAVLPIIVIAGYALLFKVPVKGRWAAYARIIMAGLTAFLLAKLLATLYQPSGERPFQLLGAAPGASYLDNPGFPSDHALFTAAIFFAVWFETRARGLAITIGVLTLVVCIGRVVALVHTPLDVIGGIAVAAVGAGWYFTGRTSKKS